MEEVEYMWHIVGHEGVWVDLKFIKVMQYCPHRWALQSMQEVLGLYGYYSNFFENYECIARPLTNLLNKMHSSR